MNFQRIIISLTCLSIPSSMIDCVESKPITIQAAEATMEGGVCSDGTLGVNGICKQDSAASTHISTDQSNETIEDKHSLRGVKESCVDTHELCDFWAERGECDINPNYMKPNCRKSCGLCDGDPSQTDKSDDNDNPDDSTYGEIQKFDGDKSLETQQRIQEVNDYMFNKVFVKPEYKSVRKECKNRHELCAFWAVIGECDANPSYMTLNCAPSCMTCDLIDIKNRCPMDPELKDVYGPGELDDMFENIVNPDGEFQKYTPVIHSRPSYPDGVSADDVDYQLGPWVITLENFVSEEECDEMIQLGYQEGYERSSDVGKMKFDGTYDVLVNDGRTSENAWCKDNCETSNATKSIEGKMEEITGIPTINYESLQILRYEVGQYYRTHHDFIEHHVNRQSGPRILTFFFYLSNVEKGGGTHFPKLNPPITIYPKKGRALIWSHVKHESPNKKDFRTEHGALPVEEGTKFAANAWIHSKDFKTPNGKGCV